MNAYNAEVFQWQDRLFSFGQKEIAILIHWHFFNLVRSRVPVKWRRPFIGRRHCTMAAPTFSMAAAIPEIRDLVRYKQFLKVNMAASSSDEQSSHQNTFASWAILQTDFLSICVNKLIDWNTNVTYIKRTANRNRCAMHRQRNSTSTDQG